LNVDALPHEIRASAAQLLVLSNLFKRPFHAVGGGRLLPEKSPAAYAQPEQ